MNETPLKNKSELHARCRNRVFVGGLKGSTTSNQVLNIFTRFGPVASVKMCADDKDPKKNKGYAVVEFENPEGFTQCLKQHEHILLDRVVTCQPYLQGKKLEAYLEELNSRRVFVKYLPNALRFNDKLELFFS